MYRIRVRVGYQLCRMKSLEKNGAVGSDAMAEFWRCHFFCVKRARRWSQSKNSIDHNSRTTGFSGLKFESDDCVIVVMIGAKASQDVNGSSIVTEVARYPLNSMDFIEFNGSDSLTASLKFLAHSRLTKKKKKVHVTADCAPH